MIAHPEEIKYNDRKRNQKKQGGMMMSTDKPGKRFTKKEWSWIMYDWANSIYATNIMAAIFPTIFVGIAGEAGDLAWGYATSIATFLIAVMAPFLGAIADFKGMKKKLFTAFMLIGVVFTAFIAATNDWRFMLVGYVISRIGFSCSNLFYDSFLTDVTTNDRMDKVSSWGYAMGYIGGSTIPFVISIAVLLVLGYSSPVAQKFSILITSVWWIAFSIPFIKNVNQEHYVERIKTSGAGRQMLGNILNTAKEIFASKGLLLFVIAYFFYIDGVGTIISISTAYGSILGLGSVGMILALLVTQIVAMPCSIIFARLSQKISARKAIIIAIIIYTSICLVGFYMGFSLEPHQNAYNAVLAPEFTDTAKAFAPEGEDNLKAYEALQEKCEEAFLSDQCDAEIAKLREEASVTEDGKTDERYIASAIQLIDLAERFTAERATEVNNYRAARSLSTILFWAMATMVGTVQGGIQAVSRSYFGKLIPKDRSNEFFGFFDIFGKFAAVVGPFLYALIGTWTGRSSYGVLCLVVLFLVGLVILITGRKHLDALTDRAENA